MPPRFPSRRLLRLNQGEDAIAARAPPEDGEVVALDRRGATVRRIDTERFGTVYVDMSRLGTARSEERDVFRE